MARLRFPGRPGYRFGRLGLSYSRDEPSENLDKATKLIVNIHKGLRYFHEIFGESDEDEEFLGFTKEDVNQASLQVEKTQLLLDELQKPISKSTRILTKHDKSYVRIEKLSQKDTKKLLQSVISEGGARPVKGGVHSKVLECEKKNEEKKKAEKKKDEEKGKDIEERKEKFKSPPFKGLRIKLQFGKGISQSRQKGKRLNQDGPKKTSPIKSKITEESDDDDDVLYTLSPTKTVENRGKKQEKPTPSKGRRKSGTEIISVPAENEAGKIAKDRKDIGPQNKSHESKIAKQLLTKAKKDNIKEIDSPQIESSKSSQKKQFMLPSVSSRSSRKIKPNKRFMEDGFSGAFGGIYSRARSTKSLVESPNKTEITDSPKIKENDSISEKFEEQITGKTIDQDSENLIESDVSSSPEVSQRNENDTITTPEKTKRGRPKTRFTSIVKTGKEKLKSSALSTFKSSRLSRHAFKNRTSKRNQADTKIGILDLPAIVEGKRERKPSNKLLQKWTDEDTNSVQRQNIEAAKRSGKTILQKAKLRLNQRALNKSKQAFVKSLEKEMKADEKSSSDSVSSDVKSPPSAPFSIQISPLKSMSPGVATAVPKFGALSMPKGPSACLENTPDTPTFGECAEESEDGEKRRTRCIACGIRLNNEGENWCAECVEFYKRSVKLHMEQGRKFPCDKIEYTNQGGGCPVTTLESYWEEHPVTGDVREHFCVFCRFELCKTVFPSPKQFYDSYYKGIKKDNTKTTGGSTSEVSEKLVNPPAAEEIVKEDSDLNRRSGSPVRDETERKKRHKKATLSPKLEQDILEGSDTESLDSDVSEKDDQTTPGNQPKKDQIVCEAISEKRKSIVQKSPRVIGHESESEQKSEVKPDKSRVEKRLGLSRKSPRGAVSMSERETETEQESESETKGISKSALEVPTQPIALGSVEESADESSGPRTRSSARGPRIKHVCRRASVALGKPSATFPDLTLSALPVVEKVKAVQGADDESDNVSADDSSQLTKETGPRGKTPRKQKQDVPQKRRRCGECPGCTAAECRECGACKDMVKYGGDGKRKESCVKRLCHNPTLPVCSSALKTFLSKRKRFLNKDAEGLKLPIKLYDKTLSPGKRKHESVDIAKRINVTKTSPAHKDAQKKKFEIQKKYPHGMTQSEDHLPALRDIAAESDSGSELVDVEGVDADEESDVSTQPTLKTVTKSLFARPSRLRAHLKRRSGKSRSSVWYDDEHEIRSLIKEYNKISPKRPALSPKRKPPRRTDREGKQGEDAPRGRMRTKLPNLQAHSQGTAGAKGDAATEPMPWKKLKEQAAQVQQQRTSNAKDHVVKLDFKEDYDIDRAREEGVVLLSTTPFCVRSVCLLCGSQGSQKLLYCNVCCEPFHWFCLEESERPLKNQLEDWCCPRCQFCHVCAKQNNYDGKTFVLTKEMSKQKLLKCTKCGDTYHPGCLGPNYPTKPTEQGVWLCTRCVKCRSCSRTTPGDKPTDKWTHNFALCQHCGSLVDKGNYCPVCHQCYSDDDWEVKMIQCESCESWVHAKCEQISDEMYEIFSLLPEETPFNCRVCAPGETRHLDLIVTEMRAGFKIILENLISSRSSECLEPIRDDETKAITEIDIAAEERAKTPEKSAALDNLQLPPISYDVEKIASAISGNNVVKNTELQHPAEEKRINVESMEVEPTPEQLPFAKANSEPRSSTDDCFKAPADRDHVLPARQVTRTISEDSRSNRATPSPVSMVSMESTDSIPTDTSSDEPSVPNQQRVIFKEPVNQEDSVSNDGDEKEDDKDSQTSLEPLRRSSRTVVLQKNETKERETADQTLRDGKEDRESADQTQRDEKQRESEDQILRDEKEAAKKSVSLMFGEPVKWVDDKKEFPRDLIAVQYKFESDGYRTVDEFCSDIVRILRYNIQQEYNSQSKKKADQASRNVFIHKMETCFPWYNVNTSTLWQYDRNLPEGMLPEAVLPPSEDHTYAQWLERDDILKSPQPSPFKRVPATPYRHGSPRSGSPRAGSPRGSPRTPWRGALWEGGTPELSGMDDVRKCGFCGEFGDKLETEAGRLLHTGLGEWVHVNCALWSAEVFEEVDGTLQNVLSALSRGRQLICNVCEKKGATVGCCALKCNANFHMICALQAACVFQEDKKVFCREHVHLSDSRLLEGKFGVERRACVDLNNNRYNKVYKQGVSAESIYLLVGSMCLEALGVLKNPLSDTPNFLLPVNYCVSRVYWSTKDPRRRCMYTCRIIEVIPEVLTTPIPARDLTVAHDKSHPRFNLNLHLKYTSLKRKSSFDSGGRRHSSLVSEEYGSDLTLSMYSTDETPMSDNTNNSSVLSSGTYNSASRWLSKDRTYSPPNENLSARFTSAARYNTRSVSVDRKPEAGDGLLKMVSRLNSAASESKRSRSRSVEKREHAVSPSSTGSTISVTSPPPSLSEDMAQLPTVVENQRQSPARVQNPVIVNQWDNPTTSITKPTTVEQTQVTTMQTVVTQRGGNVMHLQKVVDRIPSVVKIGPTVISPERKYSIIKPDQRSVSVIKTVSPGRLTSTAAIAKSNVAGYHVISHPRSKPVAMMQDQPSDKRPMMTASLGNQGVTIRTIEGGHNKVNTIHNQLGSSAIASSQNPSIIRITKKSNASNVVSNRPGESSKLALSVPSLQSQASTESEEDCKILAVDSPHVLSPPLIASRISARQASAALETLSKSEENPRQIEAAVESISMGKLDASQVRSMMVARKGNISGLTKTPSFCASNSVQPSVTVSQKYNPATSMSQGAQVTNAARATIPVNTQNIAQNTSSQSYNSKQVQHTKPTSSFVRSQPLNLQSMDVDVEQIAVPSGTGLVALSANETSEVLNDVKLDNSFTDEAEMQFSSTETNEIIQSLTVDDTHIQKVEQQSTKVKPQAFQDSFSKFLANLPDPHEDPAPSESPKVVPLVQHPIGSKAEVKMPIESPVHSASTVCSLRQPMDSEPSGFDLLDPELMSDIVSITPVGGTEQASASGSEPQRLQKAKDIPQLDGTSDDKPMTSAGHVKREQTIREKIMQKIKAESLARRSPTDHGPTKCPNCKRVYRTVASYNVHIKSCDFVVSSDDEDDDDAEDEEMAATVSGGVAQSSNPSFTLRVPRSARSSRSSISSRTSRSTPSPTSDSPKWRHLDGKHVKITCPNPEFDISLARNKRIDDDPDYNAPIEKDIHIRRKVKKNRRFNPDATSSSPPPVVSPPPVPESNPEPEPQIMYQGVPLVRTPFKRKRGRPVKHKPVLVVPPQPRENPRTTSGGMDEDEDFEDFLPIPDDVESSVHSHDSDLEHQPTMEVSQDTKSESSDVAHHQSQSRSPNTLNVQSVSRQSSTQYGIETDMHLQSQDTEVSKSLDLRSAFPIRVVPRIRESSVESQQSLGMSTSSFYKTKSESRWSGLSEKRRSSPMQVSPSPPQNTTSVVVTNPTTSNQQTSSESSQYLSSSTDIVSSSASNPAKSNPSQSQTSPRKSDETNPFKFNVKVNPVVPSVAVVQAQSEQSADVHVSQTSFQHSSVTSPLTVSTSHTSQNQGTKQVIASRSASTSPRGTMMSPKADDPSRYIDIGALENKLGQKIKVLSVSKEELQQLKKSLELQKVPMTPQVAKSDTVLVATHNKPNVSIANPVSQVIASSEKETIVIDSDSNPSPAVQQTATPFQFETNLGQSSVTTAGQSSITTTTVLVSSGNFTTGSTVTQTVTSTQAVMTSAAPRIFSYGKPLSSALPPTQPRRIVSNVPGVPVTLPSAIKPESNVRTTPAWSAKRDVPGPLRDPKPASQQHRRRMIIPSPKKSPGKERSDQPPILRRTTPPGVARSQTSPQTVDSLINSIIASQTPRQPQTAQVLRPQQMSASQHLSMGQQLRSQIIQSSPSLQNQQYVTAAASNHQGLTHQQMGANQVVANQQLGNSQMVITQPQIGGNHVVANQQVFRSGNHMYTITNQPNQQVIQNTQIAPAPNHQGQQLIVQSPTQMGQTQNATVAGNPPRIVIAGQPQLIQTAQQSPQIANLLGHVQSPPYSLSTVSPHGSQTQNLVAQMGSSPGTVQSVTQLISQQTQLVPNAQMVQASQLAQAAAGLIQGAPAGATYTIRTPAGDFQVIPNPGSQQSGAVVNPQTGTALYGQDHSQSVNQHQSHFQVQSHGHDHIAPRTISNRPVSPSRATSGRLFSSNVSESVMSHKTSFVLSNSPPPHRESNVIPKHRPPKERLSRKRPMMSPPGVSPDGSGPSQAKKARSLGELKAEQERLVDLSISQFSNYQAKHIPPETAQAMERLLQRGSLDPNFKTILETKLRTYRMFQMKKERQRAESRPLPALSRDARGTSDPRREKKLASVQERRERELRKMKKLKKSKKEPLRENIRHDTATSTAHPLIHATRRNIQLPEPAVEEEVKDVPLYSIFGQKGGAGLPVRRKDRPHLRFEIESDDGFKVQADSWDDAWKAVIDKVQDARANARMKQLSFSGVNGLSMFGLSHSAVVYLVEQLFGAHTCKNYNFKYHQYEREEVEEEPEENPTGCARSEPFVTRKPYEMFSFLLSKYRKKPIASIGSNKDSDITLKSQRRATSLELPLAMRFRALKTHSREAVGVFRSNIHGRGLFCKRDIDAGEMIIEYTGEVIRSGLTDKREKYYESKGIGCYMFRIDEDCVIDATLKGSAARFINHSCEPNCYSKIVTVDNTKHIVIFAMRQIKKGEELTYDYKFPIEDVKIPCTCSFKKCRKYLN